MTWNETQGALPHAAVALLLAVALIAVPLLRREADRLRPRSPEIAFDIPPFPAEIARPLSFGFSSLVSDLTFLEAIQILGARKANTTALGGAHEDRALARLLDYATLMDPKFGLAYRFAGMAITRHTSDGKATGVLPGQAILQRGAKECPDDWQIYFYLGFLDSYYLGDSAGAASAVAHASRLPKAPRYLGLLATRLSADAGELESARQMAQEMVEQASEPEAREEWLGRLKDIQMESDLRRIEAAQKHFTTRQGRAPASLNELVAAGEIASVPAEPHGGVYRLDGGKLKSTGGTRLVLRGRAGTVSGLEVAPW